MESRFRVIPALCWARLGLAPLGSLEWLLSTCFRVCSAWILPPAHRLLSSPSLAQTSVLIFPRNLIARTSRPLATFLEDQGTQGLPVWGLWQFGSISCYCCYTLTFSINYFFQVVHSYVHLCYVCFLQLSGILWSCSCLSEAGPQQNLLAMLGARDSTHCLSLGGCSYNRKKPLTCTRFFITST